MPPSAYILIAALDTLATKIRNEINIKWIQIDNKEIKISLSVDDITLILSELESLKVTIRILNSFEICAGLKINVDQMQSTYIGLLSSSDYFPRRLSRIKTPLDTLGIVIIDNDEDNYNRTSTRKSSLLNQSWIYGRSENYF